jgi:hypothetical protein
MLQVKVAVTVDDDELDSIRRKSHSIVIDDTGIHSMRSVGAAIAEVICGSFLCENDRHAVAEGVILALVHAGVIPQTRATWIPSEN